MRLMMTAAGVVVVVWISEEMLSFVVLKKEEEEEEDVYVVVSEYGDVPANDVPFKRRLMKVMVTIVAKTYGGCVCSR